MENLNYMMGYIRSKFSNDSIFWGIFMLIIPFPGIMIFIFKILSRYSFSINDNLFLLLFLLLFLFLINFLKHIKRIIVRGNELKYYSILRPFGRTLDLNDYTGKIILKETGSGGSYKVVYLVNKQNKASFKLMGLHYKNFDDINNAIQLKTIKFNPTTFQYFKLLFFERIEIKNKNGKGEIIDIILGIFKLISIAGIILFVLGLLIKKIF